MLRLDSSERGAEMSKSSEMPLRILQTHSSLNWGGQEKRSIEEISWLNQHGYQCWLVCDIRSSIYQRRNHFGIDEKFIIPFEFKSSWNPLTIAKLIKLVCLYRIDLVHSYGLKDGRICLWLRWFGWPVIRSTHSLLGKRSRCSSGNAFSYFDRVIASAAIIRDQLINNYGVPPDRIDLVGEGVDMEKFTPCRTGSKFRQKFHIPDNAFVVGQVGMLRKDKGQDVFIRSSHLVRQSRPDLYFVIIGEGVGSETFELECRNLAADLHREAGPDRPPIIFTGYIQDPVEGFAALNVVVQPSRSEAQSRVVPEAFAMGKPVVASNIGGLVELIQDGVNGILVPRNDPKALSEAILTIVSEPKTLERLGASALHFARQNLSFGRKMADLIQIYHLVMGKHNR